MQVIVLPNKLVRLETDGIPAHGKMFAGEGELVEVSDEYGKRLIEKGIAVKDSKGGQKAKFKAAEPPAKAE